MYGLYIFYSTDCQGSHGNWSWHANKPASIWILQIIKNLHSMTCFYGHFHHWQYYTYNIAFVNSDGNYFFYSFAILAEMNGAMLNAGWNQMVVKLKI